MATIIFEAGALSTPHLGRPLGGGSWKPPPPGCGPCGDVSTPSGTGNPGVLADPLRGAPSKV